MKKVIGVLVGIIAVAVIGVAGMLALSGTGGPLGKAADTAKATAANAVMDASDVKGQLASAIDERRDTIAAATGLTTDQVDAAVAALDIQSWQAAPLPEGAVATGTYDGAPLGIDGTITTYDDPGYVTLTAFGQTLTLAVPDTAQAAIAGLAGL